MKKLVGLGLLVVAGIVVKKVVDRKREQNVVEELVIEDQQVEEEIAIDEEETIVVENVEVVDEMDKNESFIDAHKETIKRFIKPVIKPFVQAYVYCKLFIIINGKYIIDYIKEERKTAEYNKEVAEKFYKEYGYKFR